MEETTYDLDDPILYFGNKYVWTLRDAVQGVQIFGGIGSGKTSGSGRTLALKYLKKGYGGLVLSVKSDELDIWKEYCKETNRENDLIVVNPKEKWQFNFLDYEAQRKDEGGGYTDNLVMILKTAIRAGESNQGAMISRDPFWDSALDMLLFNTIDLCRLASENGEVTLENMISLVYDIPDSLEELKGVDFHIKNAFGKALFAVKTKRDGGTISDSDFILYKRVEDYFLSDFITLAEKTKSSILHSFSGFLFRLHREPIYSLFCSGISNFTPEDSLKGKIIFLHLPIKQYDKVGRDVQIIFKYIWQRSMERRNLEENERPVFLWADESQFILHEHDTDYQSTARSKKICTVYLTQNLPNYLAHLGGEKGKHQVHSFLGTLGTKIFHANVDKETNDYAANLIGKDYTHVYNESHQMGKSGPSKTIGRTPKLDYVVPSEEFSRLETGGKRNGYAVGAFIHCQDAPWKYDGGYAYYAIFYQKPYKK